MGHMKDKPIKPPSPPKRPAPPPAKRVPKRDGLAKYAKGIKVI